MKNILDTLRSFDMFKQTISLTYKGSKNYSSLSGGSSSILFILAFVILSIMVIKNTFGNEIIVTTKKTHLEPISKLSIIRSPDDFNGITLNIRSSQQANYTYFPIGVGFQYKSNATENPNWEKFASIIFSETNFKSRGLKSTIYLKTKKCNHFGGLTKEELLIQNFESFTCIDDSYEISIFPYFSHSSEMNIEVLSCEFDCETKAKIDQFFRDNYFVIYTTSKQINATNFVNQTFNLNNYHYFEFFIGFKKEVEVKVSLNQLESNLNYVPKIFYPKPTIITVPYVEVNKPVITLNDEPKFRFTFSLNDEVTKTIIKRKEIIEQFASIIGFMFIIYIFLNLIIHPLVKFEFEYDIMNGCYIMIPPENMEKLAMNFENFIKNRYNNLINNYLKKSDFQNKLKESNQLRIPNNELNKNIQNMRNETEENINEKEIEMKIIEPTSNNIVKMKVELFNLEDDLYDAFDESLKNQSNLNKDSVSTKKLPIDLVNEKLNKGEFYIDKDKTVKKNESYISKEINNLDKTKSHSIFLNFRK